MSQGLGLVARRLERTTQGRREFPSGDRIGNDEFRDVVLDENVVEVAAIVMNVPEVGGLRLECLVRVTTSGGEMLTTTPLELSVLDA